MNRPLPRRGRGGLESARVRHSTYVTDPHRQSRDFRKIGGGLRVRPNFFGSHPALGLAFPRRGAYASSQAADRTLACRKRSAAVRSLGLSLDRMREYLSWPADGLDPYRLAAQVQVIRVVAMVTAKVEERRPDPEMAERFRQMMGDSRPSRLLATGPSRAASRRRRRAGAAG